MFQYGFVSSPSGSVSGGCGDGRALSKDTPLSPIAATSALSNRRWSCEMSNERTKAEERQQGARLAWCRAERGGGGDAMRGGRQTPQRRTS